MNTGSGLDAADPHMHRQDKRDSAKKSRDYSVYTQKAVRAKEALLEKKGSVNATPPAKH